MNEALLGLGERRWGEEAIRREAKGSDKKNEIVRQ